MICVLLLAAGEPWETAALQELESAPDLMVLRRCMDVADLLAAAGTGQAQAAVVSLGAPGFDAPAVATLTEHGVQCLAVARAPQSDEVLVRAVRIDVSTLVAPEDVDQLPDLLRELPEESQRDPAREAVPGPLGHRVVAVWGPAGAPGRTTVAAAVAAEMASASRRVTLVDADPWAPSVAQQLGLLDDTSGLLAAARSAGSGRLAEQLPRCVRRIGTHWDVLTGLPRPERWNEVRPDAFAAVLEAAKAQGEVVIDTGPSLEESPDGRPGRNSLTCDSLRMADDVVVVGTPDPVGLTRLAQGLVQVWEMGWGPKARVVVNRMRPGVGWSQTEVRDLMAQYAGSRPIHFLPDDPGAADRALLAGRSVVEVSGSGIAAAIATLVGHLPVASAPPPTSVGAGRRRVGLRRRTGSTARRR